MAAEPATQEQAPAVLPELNEGDGLLALAIQKGVDTAALEHLMQLKERFEATEARKAWVSAMAAFKAAAPSVLPKDAMVDFSSSKGRTHYKHTSLAGACSLLTPLLCEHGLTATWATAQDDAASRLTVTCRITHEQGHREDTSLTGPYDTSGNKNAMQGIGSAATYLARYTFLLATGMATAEMDDDGAGSGPRPSSGDAPNPAASPGPEPAASGGDPRDAKIGFSKEHSDETWREVDVGFLIWVRDHIDPKENDYAASRHGPALAELAAREAEKAPPASTPADIDEFPAGIGPDTIIAEKTPKSGCEHKDVPIREWPMDYLERSIGKGTGKHKKICLAEVGRREREELADGDIPFGSAEKPVEHKCQHCGSLNMTTELCTPGVAKCKDCGKHTAVEL